MRNSLFFGDDLPGPLTKKETLALFERYEKGDMDAREALILHYTPFVISRVGKKFANLPYDKSDLVSIGLIGLIKAVDTFDRNMGFSFANYAFHCVCNEILMFRRREVEEMKKLDRYSSGTMRVLFDEDKINDFQDLSVNIIEDYCLKEEYETVRNYVLELDEENRKIALLYFGFCNKTGYLQREIGSMMGVNRSTISKKLMRIVSSIKEKMEDEVPMSYVYLINELLSTPPSKEKILIR